VTELAKVTGRSRYRVLKEALTNFSLVIGVLIVGGIVFVVLFGSAWAPYNPYLVDRVVVPHYDFEEEVYIRVPVMPNEDFPLGTDQFGMDILTLILHGARNTLVAGVLVAMARVVIGLFIGLTAGWFEGKLIDRFAMGLIGVLTSLPMLISGLILIFAIGVGGGMVTFFIALSVIGWTEVAQYIRGEVLIARKMPYMEAARSIGLRELEIAVRHVIPNILPQLFIIAFLEVGAVLMLLGELALIGVFIGGGSSLDFTDIMSPPNIVTLPSQPEWGAMIANGFRWFRSNPHVVLVPAGAVFLAVLGFNALGEGLRGLFEKRGIQTSFIVSKRMLAVLAVVFMVMFAIFQSTQPVRWFRDLAGTFNVSNIEQHEENIALLADDEFGSGNPPAHAEYIAEQLRNYGARGGVRWSDFYQEKQNLHYETNWTPQLILIDENGATVASFDYGSDFSFILKEFGSAGNVRAELTLINVWPNMHLLAPRRFRGATSFAGKIVVLQEGNAPVGMSAEVVRRGAEGIIWIAQEGAEISAGSLEWVPRSEEEESRRVPIFRVSRETGEQILSEAGLIFSGPPEAQDEEAEVALQVDMQDLDVSVHMQLSLVNPVEVETTNVVAYIQGTDADLGDEIIVFVAACDGLWRSEEKLEAPDPVSTDDCMVAQMIEFARLFDESVVDLKRPMLFLIFGGQEFGDVGLSEWLANRDRNYSHLSAPGMTLQPRPSIILQFENDPTVDGLAIDDHSRDGELMGVFQEAIEWGKVELSQSERALGQPLWISGEFVPFQSSFAVNFDAENGQQVGESISLALTRMLRESILNGD
jgi:ABC-type dipeptide/oligopeptide/nickel transport system permease subunit